MTKIRLKVASLFFVALAVCACGDKGSQQDSSQSQNSSSLSSTSSVSSSSQSSSSASSEINSRYPNYNTQVQAPLSEGMEMNAEAIAEEIKLGWNLGNNLEAIGGEDAWGNPVVSSELITLVKQSGFDAIRLPVSWDQYANQATAEIQTSWLNRIKQVVQYCIDQDLYVILNVHWDEGWLENNVTTAAESEVNDKQRAFWQQIATAFRDFDQRLMFASANEPNVDNADQMEVLLSYHQTFIDAVRETGGRNAYRTLIVQGPSTDIEKTEQLMYRLPVDTVQDRLMAEVHFYTPYQFTLMTEDQSWGNQFYYWGADYHSTSMPERNATWGEEDEIEALFASMKNKFSDMGVPVLLGEFAAQRRTEQLSGADLDQHLASRAYFHKFVVERALANKLIPVYWDAGGLGNFGSGIFDRNTLTVGDQQLLNALLEGANK